MRAIASWVFVLLMMMVVVPVASAANDGGSGADAPNDRGQPLLVDAGVVTGQTSARGDDDWYRVVVPLGKAIQVTYGSSYADSWDDLRVYESDSDSFVYASPGQNAVLLPATTEVHLLVEGYWDAKDYTLTINMLTIPAQNDGATGADAPGRWANAVPVSAPRVVGRVDRTFGDLADWYLFTGDASEVIEVSTGDAYRDVHLLDADGQRFAELGAYPGYLSSVAFVPPTSTFRLGVVEPSAWSYDIPVTRTLRSDLSVDALSVTPIPLETEAAAVPVSLHREVEVRVSNDAPGPSRNARLVVTATHPGTPSAARILYDEPILLAPYGQTTVRLDWETLGELGDATLRAEVSNEFDLDAADNVASTATFVGVGGLLLGVDLLNVGHSELVDLPLTGGPDLDLKVYLEYNAYRHGPFVYAVHPWVGGGAWTRLGTHGDGSPQVDAGVGQGYNWFYV